MGGKKRKSRSSVGVDYQDEAGDLRLDRRLKRRCIAIKDSKLYSGWKDRSTEGEHVCYEAKHTTELIDVNCVKLDVDVDDNDIDSDYRAYLDSLDFEALEDNYTENCRNESDNVRFDINDLDSDYEKFIASESIIDRKVDKSRSMNTGNTADKPVSGDDSVNVSVENGLSGDELVEDVSANDHINSSNVNALDDVEPQARDFLKSNNVKPTDDELDADYQKFLDGSTLGPSGQCTKDKNDNNSDVYTLGNMESQNKEIHQSNSIESNDDGPETAADAGGSVPTRSTDNVAHRNDDLYDLQYKMFLENVRVEGNSYFLEVPVGTNSKIIEYEKDDGSHDRYRAENPKRKCQSQEAAVRTKHDCRRKIEHKVVDHSYEVFLSSMKKEGREMDYEKDDGSHDRHRAENPKRKRCSQEAAVKSKHDSKRKIEHKIVDRSYEIFLNSMKKEGRNMIFTPETGAKVVYDEDESSDSEVIVMDSDPFANEKHTPFVANLEDEGSKWLESSHRNEHSWFRERVTEILRQSFDQREYDRLLGEAYLKKPTSVDKDMRNGRTRHIIGQGIGHSYLDRHIDLGRKVTSAGSKPKVLNLLRGFFFWLQNVAHDGVFKPWLDSSCLEVLPCGRLVSK